MASVKKQNLGLFLILAAGGACLLLYPSVLTASAFITLTAGYSLVVRYLDELKPK